MLPDSTPSLEMHATIDSITATIHPRAQWGMFLVSLVPWVVIVLCFLPLWAPVVLAWLLATLPVPLSILAIILGSLLAAYLVYSKAQDLLAYATSKLVIIIDMESVSVQSSAFGFTHSKRYPAETIKAIMLVPTLSSLFSRRFQSAPTTSQAYSLALLTNRSLRPVAALATGLPAADAQSLLSAVYSRFPQYAYGAGTVGPA